VAFKIIGDPAGNIAIGGSNDRRETDETLKDFDCVQWSSPLTGLSSRKLRMACHVYLLKCE
jgi:hypothetical protein